MGAIKKPRLLRRGRVGAGDHLGIAEYLLTVLDAIDVCAHPHIHLSLAQSRTNFPRAVFPDEFVSSVGFIVGEILGVIGSPLQHGHCVVQV